MCVTTALRKINLAGEGEFSCPPASDLQGCTQGLRICYICITVSLLFPRVSNTLVHTVNLAKAINNVIIQRRISLHPGAVHLREANKWQLPEAIYIHQQTIVHEHAASPSFSPPHCSIPQLTPTTEQNYFWV